MDLSTLDLPLRSERKKHSPFGFPPPVSSVNVTYETAEAQLAPLDKEEPSRRRFDSHEPSDGSPNARMPLPRLMSVPQLRQSTPDSPRMRRNNSSTSVPTNASINASRTDSEVSSRNRSRSNASIASEECHGFITSLKEPKYNKPLSPDEIAWLFQDFYIKLRHDLQAQEYSLDDSEKSSEKEIDGILDRVEKLVAGGELHSRLFGLASSHDVQLNSRIAAFRENAELRADLLKKLDLGPLADVDLSGVYTHLNRVARETAPKSKLSGVIKAHHALVEILETEQNADADSLIPLFIYSIIFSDTDNWWQNFMFIKRFRRSSELSGHAAYCLTNVEAAIVFIEKYTLELSPDSGPELIQFSHPIENPRSPKSRSRSGSQSSRASVTPTNFGPLGARIGETLSSYRTMLLSARRPSQPLSSPFIEQRFMQMDADSLTISDVKVLLREYKRLAEYVEKTRH